jgi:hypothetical protein
MQQSKALAGTSKPPTRNLDFTVRIQHNARGKSLCLDVFNLLLLLLGIEPRA